MRQAQGANLANLLNGIASNLKVEYVTTGINADPETKLRNGQQCATVRTAFATCNMRAHLNIARVLLPLLLKVSYSYMLIAFFEQTNSERRRRDFLGPDL